MTGALRPILTGFALIAITVIIHGLGTTMVIRFFQRRRSLLSASHRTRLGLLVLPLIAIFLLFLHSVQILLWAVVYSTTPEILGPETFQAAVYFSAVTFTTLGYGDIILKGSWRILSGMEAMNGILLFGWSTALLYAIVRRMWTRG